MSHHLGKRLSALIDGELGDADRERVLRHLAWCESCRDEAVTLRAIKRRMRALGEATAGDALNQRLIGLAASSGNPVNGPRVPFGGHRRRRSASLLCEPSRTRRRRHARALAAVAAVLVAVSIPTAAFLVGGRQRPQGPRVTPAVDVFMVQHAITTGEVPVQPTSSAVPISPGATPSLP